MNKNSDNLRLSRVTLITSLGDFVSFFAILKMIQDLGYGPLYSGYSVVVKSIAVGLGGATLPWVLQRWNTKRIVTAAQLGSGVLIFLLLALASGHLFRLGVAFPVLFLQTILKQWFDGARELHSKALGVHQEQLPLQAQLLSGFYSAQFVGPILSYGLIYFFPLRISLLIDGASFLAAGFYAFGLTKGVISDRGANVFAPFKYIWKKPLIARILLLRSIGFWCGMGIFNYLLFSVVTEHFKLDVVNSAWIYSAIGLGGALGIATLRQVVDRTYFKRMEGKVAFAAHLIIAGMMASFYAVPSLSIALLMMIVSGVGMGVNAATTQAIRRQVTTAKEFPEVVGLELILGRGADLVVSTCVQAALLSGCVSLRTALTLGASCLVVTGMGYLGSWDPESC